MLPGRYGEATAVAWSAQRGALARTAAPMQLTRIGDDCIRLSGIGSVPWRPLAVAPVGL